MGAKLGSAKRARKLAKLFEAWRQAFDAQDYAAMQSARRAIDVVMNNSSADGRPGSEG